MGMLTRESILNAEDLVREEVEVKEWGGSVFVRGLTGEERDDFEQDMLGDTTTKGKRQRTKNLRAALVVRAACDEEGNAIFQKQDITPLGRKSAQALNRVFEVASKLSGLGADDVEELVEDFSETQGEPTS